MADGIVHIAGPWIEVGTQLRQRCAWCGAVLIDYGTCKDCWTKALAAADAVLAALAGDPGDLPQRLVDAILDMPNTVLTDERHRDHDYAIGCAVCKGDVPAMVQAVMGVRDELMVNLAARLADAERRAEHAEGELSARRDHETRWELERQKRTEAEAELARTDSNLTDADADATSWHDTYQQHAGAVDKFFAELLEMLPGAQDAGSDAYDQIPRAIEALRAELSEAREERDLAIAHDRQPYPTAWAYGQACKALAAQRTRAEDAEAERDNCLDRLRKAEGAYSRLDAQHRDLEGVRDRLKARALQAEERIDGQAWDDLTAERDALKATEQRVRAVAAQARSSMGRVNDYVPVADLRAALDGGK